MQTCFLLFFVCLGCGAEALVVYVMLWRSLYIVFPSPIYGFWLLLLVAPSFSLSVSLSNLDYDRGTITFCNLWHTMYVIILVWYENRNVHSRPLLSLSFLFIKAYCYGIFVEQRKSYFPFLTSSKLCILMFLKNNYTVMWLDNI